LRLLSTFVTSGLDPRHGFKFFRAARSTLALLSLEIWGLCATIPLTLSSSALRLESAAGGESPWQWPALQSPFGLLLLVVFLAPALIDATSSRSAAELHSIHRIAPSRALVLCDWALILFKCEVAAGIFLGGAMPFGTSLDTGSLTLGIAAYQLKYLMLVLLLAKLRAVLDFPRAEEIALPYLRWLSVPLVLFAGMSLISIEAERFALLRWICAASGYGLCLALVVGLAGLAIARRTATSASSSINPWL
jgi:hypothetical protein